MKSHCAKGWLLSGLAMLAVPVVAATAYAVKDSELVITVPAGETNSFDSANWLTTLTDNAVTSILKDGDGGLIMNADISAYTGTIRITNGTWRVVDSKGLGLCKNGGAVYVKDGATLEGRSSVKSGINFSGKTIYFEGRGKNGIGALVLACSANQTGATWGSTMIMTGDAFVNGLNDYHYYFTNVKLNMNGHTLTLNNFYDPRYPGRLVVFTDFEISNPGNIEVINKTRLMFQSYNNIRGSSASSLIMRDASDIESPGGSNGMRGNYNWTLDWQSTGTNDFQDLSTGSGNKNMWLGPVILRRQMTVSSLRSFTLAGPVSGDGGITILAKDSGQSVLNLSNANNTFLGGVTARGVTVNAACGAIPSEGGVIDITNGDLRMTEDSACYLPTGVMSVATANVVSNGVGTWKHLTKAGDGELEYVSRIGGDCLKVDGGTFSLKETGYGSWMDGVCEGIVYYSDRQHAYKDLGGKAVYRTSVQSSPRHLYTGYGDADRKSQSWCEIPSGGGYLIVYTGYIWNHDATNVTWTFAGTLDAQSLVAIDGANVFYNTNTKICSHKNVVLTPGPHTLYIATAAKINDGGVTSSPTNMAWKSLGIRYDPLGRDSTSSGDYRKIENNSGSKPLLTWCKPGETAATPVPDKILDRAVVVSGGTSTNVADYALFSKMAFASGTAVDFAGIEYAIDELCGIPSVTDCAGLAVSNRWTVDTLDLRNGCKLTGVRLAFGDDAEMSVTKSIRARCGSWVIAESTEDITGSLTVKDETLALEWSVEISGRQVILTRRGTGTMLLVK